MDIKSQTPQEGKQTKGKGTHEPRLNTSLCASTFPSVYIFDPICLSIWVYLLLLPLSFPFSFLPFFLSFPLPLILSSFLSSFLRVFLYFCLPVLLSFLPLSSFLPSLLACLLPFFMRFRLFQQGCPTLSRNFWREAMVSKFQKPDPPLQVLQPVVSFPPIPAGTSSSLPSLLWAVRTPPPSATSNAILWFQTQALYTWSQMRFANPSPTVTSRQRKNFSLLVRIQFNRRAPSKTIREAQIYCFFRAAAHPHAGAGQNAGLQI